MPCDLVFLSTRDKPRLLRKWRHGGLCHTSFSICFLSTCGISTWDELDCLVARTFCALQNISRPSLKEIYASYTLYKDQLNLTLVEIGHGIGDKM
ncbi:hypothetical protein VTI28DRAFT_3856 [Corynascus sepedonium]